MPMRDRLSPDRGRLQQTVQLRQQAVDIRRLWHLVGELSETLPSVRAVRLVTHLAACGPAEALMLLFSDDDGIDAACAESPQAVGPWILADEPAVRVRADLHNGGFYFAATTVAVVTIGGMWQVLTPPLTLLEGRLSEPLARGGIAVFSPRRVSPAGELEAPTSAVLPLVDTGKIPLAAEPIPAETVVTAGWTGQQWVILSYDCEAV